MVTKSKFPANLFKGKESKDEKKGNPFAKKPKRFNEGGPVAGDFAIGSPQDQEMLMRKAMQDKMAAEPARMARMSVPPTATPMPMPGGDTLQGKSPEDIEKIKAKHLANGLNPPKFTPAPEGEINLPMPISRGKEEYGGGAMPPLVFPALDAKGFDPQRPAPTSAPMPMRQRPMPMRRKPATMGRDQTAFAKGGMVGGRGDGIAQRGKTKGRVC